MTLRQLGRAARAEAFLLVAGALVGLLVGLALALGMPKEYRATAMMYVSADAVDTSGAYRGGELAAQEVRSYAGILTGPGVAALVHQKLGVARSAEQLRAQISAVTPPDGTVLGAAATDRDPATAAAVANAAAEALVRVVTGIEAPTTPGALPQVAVRIVEPAVAPASPVSPVLPVDLVVGLVVGLAAGVAAAAVRRALDTTVASADALAEVVAVPVLATIDTRVGAESFRTLRGALRFLDVDVPRRVLLVTSAVAAEGKTTTAVGAATALAETGTSVCLVEADLRRPAAAARLDVDGAVGLTSVLRGAIDLSDAVVPPGSLPLAVLPAGPLPPNPAELLGSRRLREVLEALRARYDVVLVDGAPVLPVGDSLALASACDGVLLTCRYGSTRREEVAAAADAVETVGGTVVGAVLTMAPPRRAADGYAGYGDAARTGAAPATLPA